MKISSHAPSFLPWAGYWNKVASADLFLLTGEGYYNGQAYQNRVTFDGALAIIPLDKATKHGPLRKVKIAAELAVPTLAQRIHHTYRGPRFPFAHRLEPLIETMHMMGVQHNLMRVNVQLHHVVAGLLNIQTETRVDTAPTQAKTPTEHLAALIVRYDEDPVYYAGPGAMTYLSLQPPPFPVQVQKFREPICRDSIVQVIAQEPDPEDYVRTCATWGPLES